MDNIYLAEPVEILNIREHTPLERSFLLNLKLKEEPGRFLMVSFPNVGEVPISISGFSNKEIELTIRNAGYVTSRIFNLNPGSVLFIRGPYGNGFPLEVFKGGHLLIIAGGSGIAAVKPLIEYYLNGHSSELKRLDVLAGFKSPRHIIFRQELEHWKKMRLGLGNKYIDVEITVDSDEDYAWMGSIGFVVNFIKNVKGVGEDTKIIVIGPPLMMRNSVRELLHYKVKEENIWLSFERHMKCGVGKCGHCRIRDKYVCIDGPVFNYTEAKELID